MPHLPRLSRKSDWRTEAQDIKRTINCPEMVTNTLAKAYDAA